MKNKKKYIVKDENGEIIKETDSSFLAKRTAIQMGKLRNEYGIMIYETVIKNR